MVPSAFSLSKWPCSHRSSLVDDLREIVKAIEMRLCSLYFSPSLSQHFVFQVDSTPLIAGVSEFIRGDS